MKPTHTSTTIAPFFVALAALTAATSYAPAALAGSQAHPGFGGLRAIEVPGGKARAQQALRARALPLRKAGKPVTVCKESYTEFKCTTETGG